MESVKKMNQLLNPTELTSPNNKTPENKKPKKYNYSPGKKPVKIYTDVEIASFSCKPLFENDSLFIVR
jgi:hypothetical protein